MKSLHRLAVWIGVAFVLCALWFAAQPAFAQGKYPNKPVILVVPYAPGGLPDTVARIIGKALGDKWASSY